jgi:hypothetical protein
VTLCAPSTKAPGRSTDGASGTIVGNAVNEELHRYQGIFGNVPIWSALDIWIRAREWTFSESVPANGGGSGIGIEPGR